MLECLDNAVGVKGICGDSETYDFWIEQLPGMTFKTFDSTVNAEYKDAYDMVLDKIAFAKKMVIDEVRQYLSRKIIKPTFVEEDTIGYWNDNLVPVASEAGYYKGVRVKIDRYPNMAFNAASLWLWVDTSGDIDVKVIDLTQGKVLETITVTAVANTPTELIINKKYFTNRQKLNLFFAWDSGVAGTFKTSLSSTGNDCATCHNGYKLNRFVEVSGMKILKTSALINSNLIANPGTNGISITYSVECAVEPFICSISKSLSSAILYRAGAEIAFHMENDMDRMNHIVYTGNKTFAELFADYGAMYDSKMNNIFKNLTLPNDECYQCKPLTQVIPRIP